MSILLAVAAHAAAGTIGPRSSGATGTTKGVTLGTRRTPPVTDITKSSAKVSTSAVANANSYLWYINGIAHGHSDAPVYTVVGLKPKTNYRVSVAADTTTGAPGKQSAAKSFTTKSK